MDSINCFIEEHHLFYYKVIDLNQLYGKIVLHKPNSLGKEEQ